MVGILIILDTDATKSLKVNLADFKNITDLQAKLAKQFGMEDAMERNYGLRDRD